MTPRPNRRLFVDLTPLRRSAKFRYLLGGQLVSTLGTQLTVVAVPYQVYRMTHSSLMVGLVSLAQLGPLLLGSLIGGSTVDAVDRRRLLLLVEVLMAGSSAGLALNVDLGSALWPLFVFPALTAGFSGFDGPARNAIIPNLIGEEAIPTASAMFQALFQLGTVVGPAAGGLLLAGAGINFVYWLDAASFAASWLSVMALPPQPPEGGGRKIGLGSIVEGFRFIKGKQAIQGAYLIDINAMVFGMPRALFPALAANVFGGGAGVLGFLYAAPGAGALIGAVTTGWVDHVRRKGRAVIIAVIAWGAAIAAFGFVTWLPGALLLLAAAGWADVLSAVFRNTIVLQGVPDQIRGRLSALQTATVTSGPRLGDVEAGVVASAFGDQLSIVSGGLACIAGALILARVLPGFRKQSSQVVGDRSAAGPAATEAIVELEGTGGSGRSPLGS